MEAVSCAHARKCVCVCVCVCVVCATHTHTHTHSLSLYYTLPPPLCEHLYEDFAVESNDCTAIVVHALAIVALRATAQIRDEAGEKAVNKVNVWTQRGL